MLFRSYRYAYLPFNNGKFSFELGNFYPLLAVYEDGEWSTNPYIDYGDVFYSKCADYEVMLTVPEDYLVVASGSEEKLTSNNGYTTWQLTAANMRDITITASNNLGKLTEKVNDIDVNSYYFLEDRDGSHEAFGEAALHGAVEAIKLFQEAYGPYIYDEIDVVESYLTYGGMEYPAFVRISSVIAGFMKDYSEDELIKLNGVLQPQIENAVAHEVAHQWFSIMIGNDSYMESWLDESFATFSTLLFKKMYVEEEVFDELVKLEESPHFLNLPLHDYDDMNYASVVYDQGSLFLYRIYEILGEGTFFQMMQSYYHAFVLSEVTTSDFIDLITPYAVEHEEIKSLMNAYLLQ